MNTKTLVLIFLIVNLSCSSKEEREESTTYSLDSIAMPNIDTLGLSNDTLLQREDLIFAWDDDLINLTKSDLNFSSTKKIQKNAYVEGQIDTIELFSYKESNIEVYHADGKDILIASDIRNKEFPLSKGIVIGIARQEVDTILNTKSNSDTLHLSDLENNTNVLLIFTNNILSRIIYSAYVE